MIYCQRLLGANVTMSDTTLRYLETLRILPRHPRKATAAEIHRDLESAGFSIDRRSVERDLHRLSEHFPISCEEGVRPVGWYWLQGADGLMAPGLSTQEALELDLVARYLKPMVPMSSWGSLEPRLSNARATLRTLAGAPLARWRKRVTVVLDTPPLTAPWQSSEVVDAVQEALLHRRQIAVDYQAADSETAEPRVLHPIALIHQGPVAYLVAMIWDYDDLRLLALHRMSNAKVLDEPSRDKEGFDLDGYIREQQGLGFPTGKNIRLKLRVSWWLKRMLEERRLSDDQAIKTTGGEEEAVVTATVAESERLVWWLRSHGEGVEVLAPKSLRNRLAAEYANLADTYSAE